VFGSSPGTWHVYLWSLIRSTPALHRAFAAYLAIEDEGAEATRSVATAAEIIRNWPIV